MIHLHHNIYTKYHKARKMFKIMIKNKLFLGRFGERSTSKWRHRHRVWEIKHLYLVVAV